MIEFESGEGGELGKGVRDRPLKRVERKVYRGDPVVITVTAHSVPRFLARITEAPIFVLFPVRPVRAVKEVREGLNFRG